MQLHVSPRAEVLFTLGPLNFTNSMLMMYIIMTGLVISSYLITRRTRLVPGRFQSAMEMVIEMVLGLTESALGKRYGRIFLPLCGTIFIYVLVANLANLFPGFGTIGINHVVDGQTEFIPIFRAANADVNMTLAMAIITFIVFQYVGLRQHGLIGRIKEMSQPYFMAPLLFPIHLISEFSRLISLTFRLFGNTFAGEVLLPLMISLTWIGVVPFMGLEMLFAYIHALVFSVLTLVYITLAFGGLPTEHGSHEH
jgi:F-type H+-transporting ATPase subunit a